MNQSTRKNTLFTLCKALVELLGKEKALADLQLLYKRHPEMFRDESEVEEIIEQVVREPDLIIKNPKAKSDRDFMVFKKLDDKKMGDVGIRNDNGVNIIFHTNKKNISKFRKIEKSQTLVEASSAKAAPTRLDHYASKSNDLPKCKEAPSMSATVNGEAVHSLHTPSQARMGGNEKSSGANALSSTAESNSTTIPNASQTKIRKHK